ncbi:hypothetical protein BST61_g2817 [Cercospora zeina]
MSQTAQRLLRTPCEVSNTLRVVFTPVGTARALAKNGRAETTCEEAQSIRRQTRGRGRRAVSGGIDESRKNEAIQANAGHVGKRPQAREEVYAKRYRHRSKAAQTNPEVVGEQLMVDVLAYLAPTLEQYKGCTLVDIYPGSCRWSQKIHDFLQPKCHLLLEPDTQYQEYIDELVNTPHSTYTHIALPGAMHLDMSATYKHLFQDDGPIPATDRLSDSGPVRTNPSILVIGSLNRMQTVKNRGKLFSGSLASMYQFCYGALVNGYMHESGPVRMLLWTPEQDRIQFIPERAMYRNKSDATISIAMHVQTAVAVQPVIKRKRQNEWSSRSRWSGLHLASEEVVRARAEQRGMKVPRNRQIFHITPGDRSGSTKQAAESSPYELRYETKEQLEQAIDGLVRHWNARTEGGQGMPLRDGSRLKRTVGQVCEYLAFPELADALCEDPGKSYKAAESAKARSEEMIQQGSLPNMEMEPSARQGERHRLSTLSGVDARIAVLADAALRGVNLEIHCKILEEQGYDVTELKGKLVDFADMVVQESRAVKILAVDFQRLVDDWTSFFAPSQLLMSDRRHYEPLQADPSDFSPQGNLCLLDCIPTNCDLEVPGLADRRTAALAFRDIVGYLYQTKNQSVTTMLEKLAPNASIDLVNMVPAITDPKKGGRLDPRHLKVRQLTSEMLEGLTKAWFEWPFKPERWELNFGASEVDYSKADHMGPLTPEAVTGEDYNDDAV